MNSNKKKGGRSLNDHWKNFEHDEVSTDGHVRATCKFCGYSIYRDESVKMASHIANHCKEVSGLVIRKYLEKFSETETETENIQKNEKKQYLKMNKLFWNNLSEKLKN